MMKTKFTLLLFFACLNGLAYHIKGDYNKSVEYHKQALKMQKELLGADAPHPDVATSLNNLGLAYNSKCDYDKAIEYFEKALNMVSHTLGQTHPDTQLYQHNLEWAKTRKQEASGDHTT